MKDFLLLAMKKFLESRWVPRKPLLIGYSGGPDSKALLYLLLECRRFLPLDLHLAHIDHGWREESGREAAALAEEAERLNLPFYLQTLKKESFASGNLEEQGRNFRCQFFGELYRSLHCQALLLGHQADDQAEVVLKRVFEGSSLFAISSISLESFVMDMQVWRPLLPFPKRQLLSWLSEKNLSYIQDATNLSDRFLRGKMRLEMIPLLEASFGKDVTSNLCQLGEESRDIRNYFSTLNRSILKSVLQDAEGVSRLDLNPFFPLSAIQLKYLLKEWLKQEGMVFSRQILDGVIAGLLGGREEKKFQSKRGLLSVKNRMLILRKSSY